MNSLTVGYAQKVITPVLDTPVYLAGFGQNRVAQSVHDDLYARAIALQLGSNSIVLVALDLLGLGRGHCLEIVARLKEQQPEVQLIIACTHVHHGPDTIGLWGPDMLTSGVNRAYLDMVINTVIEVTLEALQKAQPAQIRTASVQVPDVAKNARDPHIRDEELTSIQFSSPENGSSIVTWLIFPCHPEVLWDGNPHITSDYADRLRKKIEAESGAPAIFMVGALGGMMTPDVERHDFDESARMGEILANAALKALATAETRAANRLSYQRQVFTIPLKSFLFEEAARVGLLPDVQDADGNVTTETGLLKLDSIWFAMIPGELLPKLGLEIKAEFLAAGASLAAVIGLANDEIGYILPEEDYVYPENPFEPGAHYEETMSVGPETAPRLMAALHSLWKS